MSILSRKTQRVEPVRLDPTHTKPGVKEQSYDFWLTHQNTIVISIILFFIFILLVMMGYAAATGHMHFLSSEANTYEHMNQIVLYTGGVLGC